MTVTAFLAFLGVSILVIATPGLDTALTVRNALAGGRAGGVFTALGVMLGQTIWSLATSAARVWAMRAMVVNNVLSRREGSMLFVPVQ